MEQFMSCITIVFRRAEVWNPPKSVLPQRHVAQVFKAFGFGYDSINDDYILVRFAEYCDNEVHNCFVEFMIYSMRHDSWRLDEDACTKKKWGKMHWLWGQRWRCPSKQPLNPFDVRV